MLYTALAELVPMVVLERRIVPFPLGFQEQCKRIAADMVWWLDYLQDLFQGWIHTRSGCYC